jgi:hypothetical protein
VRPRRRLGAAFPNDAAVRADNHRAYRRVRRSRLRRLPGEIEGALHVLGNHGADIIRQGTGN